MEKEIEYAERLIDKHIPHTRVFHEVLGWEDYLESAIQCAIIDVENTMDALNEQYIEIWGKSKDWKYTEHNTFYQTVLQILKDKL